MAARCFLSLIFVLAGAGCAFGQAAWEFSPYKVQCLVALPTSPQFSPAVHEAAMLTLAHRAEVVFAAAWDFQAEIAASPAREEVLDRLDTLTPDQIQVLASPALENDKLYLAAVGERDGAFAIAVREFDCRTRFLGPLIEREAHQRGAIGLAIWDAIAEAFTPLVRIETVDEAKVTARLRAGGLITDPSSLAQVQPGGVLRVTVRRNDRKGDPLKGGIQLLPWTLLRVDQRSESLLTCTLVSGYRAPLPTRGGQRTERLGLLVSPRYLTTRLVLRSRAKNPQPLAGYEVYLKGEGKDETRSLGVTDWDGTRELPRGDGLLQVLLIKSGSQLLARLPLVPGQDPELVATVLDDERRLQAEGFVQAFQSRVMDIVARREICAARFRQRLADGDLAAAKKLLDEYRSLETRADLNRALDEQLQSVVSADKITQQRIDKLLASARQLLLKFLDPEQANVLAKELATATSNPPKAKTTAVKAAAKP